MSDLSEILGPKPEPPIDPIYPTPWEARGSDLYDAEGHYILNIFASAASVAQDETLAEYLVRLVNSDQDPSWTQLRDFKHGWFEVEPGWAVYASSRAKAEVDHKRMNAGVEKYYGAAVTSSFLSNHS